MGLQIYEAIGFQGILEKGSHSKPWIILINIENEIKPYVVKLYKTADIEARNKMTAEVLGNVIAQDFGFNSPNPAIIEFTPQFCMQLNCECDEIIADIDARPKFGCEYIMGSTVFRKQTKASQTNRIINPGSLYAYDYFICNRDRNNNKPNLLVKDGDAILIDHEMGLEIDENTISRIKCREWDSRYQHHIFYEILKRKSNKSSIFDEFLFYLQSFNINRYDSYFSQLEDLGFNTQKELIKRYWATIKENNSIFANILQASIG
ncbi:MAG: hypothetical protein LBV71_06310 [Prevotella sp.]|jgi:predicted transcriptional regulator|nr:hypothetical protein [Prevotella sp.]